MISLGLIQALRQWSSGLPGENARSGADQPAEGSREMALVGKAAFGCELSEGRAACNELSANEFDAKAALIFPY
jgi:hypothetical protein